MRAELVVLLVACGPSVVHKGGRLVARDSLASASSDPAAIEKLIRGPLMNGGLWFDDATCKQAFGNPGPIAAEQTHAFAACLAGLHLRASERFDMLPDVAVFEYPPGIEVEARIVEDKDGPRLTWLGYESRRSDADSLPTISSALLESLRTGGARAVITDPLRYAWFKVCLDGDGAVANATPFHVWSFEQMHQLEAQIAGWRFKATPVGPACSMVWAGVPPAKGAPALPFPRGLNDPIELSDVHRTVGDLTIRPTAEIRNAMRSPEVGPRIRGVYRICVDESGHPTSVMIEQSSKVPAFDIQAVQSIKESWVYAPASDNGVPTAFCTVVTRELSIN